MDDEETFLRLLDEHDGIVHKVAGSYSNGLADRLDLRQEITLRLWKAYKRYSPDRPFLTWMYRIALKVAISFLRRNTHPARQTVSLDDKEIELVDETAGSAEPDERILLLQQVIASLAPLDRGLMLLYLDDHSYREIAAVLGLTETNGPAGRRLVLPEQCHLPGSPLGDYSLAPSTRRRKARRQRRRPRCHARASSAR